MMMAAEDLLLQAPEERILFADDWRKELAGVLPTLPAGTLAVFTGRHWLDAGGVWADFAAVADATGRKVVRFNDIEAEPCTDTVERMVEFLSSVSASAVIAVGGGSVMDAAKAALLVRESGMPLGELFGVDRYSTEHPEAKPARVLCIPTTSGTGSEVTPAAVVSDPELGRKITLVASQLVPACAVLDPTLTVGLPPAITAATGMDALSHAMESITCIRHNPLTDGIALAAVRMIAKYLPVCVENGRDEDARGHMMIAATMAGAAFGNTPTHVGHACAHAMGARWHIPHGTACALALPFAMENCSRVAESQIALIADALKIRDDSLTPEEQARRVAIWVEQFGDSIGIPTLRELGADPADLDTIVEMSLNEKPLILLSGEPVTREACRAYYERLFAR